MTQPQPPPMMNPMSPPLPPAPNLQPKVQPPPPITGKVPMNAQPNPNFHPLPQQSQNSQNASALGQRVTKRKNDELSNINDENIKRVLMELSTPTSSQSPEAQARVAQLLGPLFYTNFEQRKEHIILQGSFTVYYIKH